MATPIKTNKSTKTQAATTPVTPVPAPAPAANPIDITSLTPAQIIALQKRLREARQADHKDHAGWVTLVDTMLHEKEGEGFKWTTADILASVIAKGYVKPTLSSDERAMEIKRIQTRKQLLEKKRDDKGNLLHSVGYKPSATSFGPLTPERILEWLAVPANVELLTVTQATSIYKAIEHII